MQKITKNRHRFQSQENQFFTTKNITQVASTAQNQVTPFAQKLSLRTTLKAIGFVTTSGLSLSTAYAGGFSLYTEASTVAVGNFGAGVAAECADASIGWYNPAGMVLLGEQQAVFSGVGVFPRIAATGTSRFQTDDFDEPYVQSFRGLEGAVNAAVPAFHYVKPLGPRAAFGFNIISPFGLSTDWGDTSAVRYSGTYTQLLILNASPELAGFITDNWAWGAGLDFQWAKVTFDGVVGSPAALQFLESAGGEVTPTTLDSTTNNHGTSFGIGYHTGVLGIFNDKHTRVGLNYQSSIAHQFTDGSLLTGRLADPELTDPNATFFSGFLSSNRVQFPDVLTLSGYQDLTKKWAMLSSVVYTGWSHFKTIQLNNVAAYSVESSEQSYEQVVSQEDYRNTWRFSLGTNYHMTDRWMMRFGCGFDQTPTVNEQRNIRLPDANRWAVAAGTHFQVRPDIGIDLAYSYIWAAQNAFIDKAQILGPTSVNIIQAVGNSHVNLVAAQVVWNIDADLKHTA